MKRKRIILLLVVFGVVGSICLTRWFQVKQARDSYVELPDPNEIAEMKVEISLGGLEWALGLERRDDEMEKSTIPQKHWKPVFDSFRPYERPGSSWIPEFGVKGLVVGHLSIRLRDGTTWRTFLLVFGQRDHIVFTVGPNNVRHKGGHKRKLYDALKAARKASQNEK